MAGIHSVLAGSGARLRVVIDITVNQLNYVFNTAKVPGYIPGFTDAVFNIASGVVLSASSTGVYAGDVDTSWNAQDTILITGSGCFIVGAGGAGGAGNSNPGAAGGPAFRAQRPVSFNNGGTIAGGGGGGGGGAGSFVSTGGGKDPVITYSAGGGGGGGGRSSIAVNAPGGAGGAASGANGGNAPGNPGGTGTFSAAGGGGGGGNASPAVGGTGGSGGGWGSAGASAGAAGGAGGAAVVGNANITWVATGTRLGAIT